MSSRQRVAFALRARATSLFYRIAREEFTREMEAVAWRNYKRLRSLADAIEAQ